MDNRSTELIDSREYWREGLGGKGTGTKLPGSLLASPEVFKSRGSCPEQSKKTWKGKTELRGTSIGCTRLLVSLQGNISTSTASPTSPPSPSSARQHLHANSFTHPSSQPFIHMPTPSPTPPPSPSPARQHPHANSPSSARQHLHANSFTHPSSQPFIHMPTPSPTPPPSPSSAR